MPCPNILKAEVDADSLQMLHAAHNLLEVLDTVKERELLLPGRQAPPARVRRIHNRPQNFAPRIKFVRVWGSKLKSQRTPNESTPCVIVGTTPIISRIVLQRGNGRE